MERTQKYTGILSSLPIPKELLEKYKFTDTTRIKIGELIHIFRPLIYCYALRRFGLRSFIPYIISLVLDLIRLILQRKMKFYSKEDKEEMKSRTWSIWINYLLREPVYTTLLKPKLIEPILGKIGSKIPLLKTLIMYIIEVRRSISLL